MNRSDAASAGEHELAALRRGDRAGAHTLRLTGLSCFPHEVFGLAETLEVLDLSGGSLTTLPDDLPRLSKLRVLFCSGNSFPRLPAVLGSCAALSQVGFRGSGVHEVPEDALPPRLRWLTLTDNAIERLPAAIGRRPLLQKLMLAGNRLTDLPETLVDAARLELLRISANAFEALPPWLPDLPRLAWLAFAGNSAEPAPARRAAPTARWADLALGPLLGEGASGRVHAARWRSLDGDRHVALKIYKGAMTSDGLPDHEIEACLAAGGHPDLVGAMARVADHPDGAAALVMPLLPPEWQVLAGPPSLESCSRDVYRPGFTLSPDQATAIAAAAARATAWLHGTGYTHGDLYAHNILWNPADGAAKLSDFGGASRLPSGAMGEGLRKIEVRAWGILAAELAAVGGEPDHLSNLVQACLQPQGSARPTLADVADTLAT